MIKVGDKLHHQEKEWNVEFTGETFVHLKHGDDFIIESSHIFWNKLYAEQKQRADELEKSLNLSILASSNDTLVEESQKALSESNKRADELEKRWSELKETLLLYKNVPQSTQTFDTVFELMKEMESEKENDE
ncbi:hypothetical protein CW689_01370 [Macrococcoides caseolyticum]|uniref:hypothetical protein n=1 Tax=Macrococcoides caseolyticum TaxID=69966 RepID=UPI000C330881|nr:hypothetical protein [Macrococcus caseolyticus]PKE25142.1 hypothetical protein CW689_01370 [Macrococcus caseolyticus]